MPYWENFITQSVLNPIKIEINCVDNDLNVVKTVITPTKKKNVTLIGPFLVIMEVYCNNSDAKHITYLI
jgi:hypothetical protein